MQQWEYLDVYVETTFGGYRVKYVNNQEVSNWRKGPYYTEYLTRLGKEGWELVTTWGGAGSLGYFVFKRPLSAV